MVDKKALLAAILTQLENELLIAVNAANNARLDAIDDQSVAETQYDTLGIEASYLAHGQSERADAISNQILIYQQLVLKDFNENDSIELGAIVEVSNAVTTHCYFIGPSAGGMVLSINRQKVTVISPSAPLAKALLGKYLDDEIGTIGKSPQAFDIVGLY